MDFVLWDYREAGLELHGEDNVWCWRGHSPGSLKGKGGRSEGKWIKRGKYCREKMWVKLQYGSLNIIKSVKYPYGNNPLLMTFGINLCTAL